MEDYISATSRATGVTDDELRPAMANLVRATGDVTEAQDLMATAMDISCCPGSAPRSGHAGHRQSGPRECGCVGSDGTPGEGFDRSDDGFRRGDRRCERDDGGGYR